MDALWQTIIGGLAVAAITGLTVVAYRHPAAYGRIYRPLLCALVGAWAVWFIYGIGYTSGFSRAVLATINLNSGSAVKTPDQEQPSFWLYMVPVIAYGYLGLLNILPHVLREEAEDPESGE